MVVDDEYANVYFLKRVLTGEGYDVTTATNGREALKILEQSKPDAILLDIMMPEVTGLEVLRRVKEDGSIKNIPVIMVSAKTESGDIELALDMGAVEYIRKPVDEIELLARLRTALRLRHYQKQLEENIKAKEDFIRIVAHDLRTPFTTISGFAEMLKNDESLSKFYSREQMEFLNFIFTSSSFLVEYFNKLLNWSKIGSQNLMLNKDFHLLKPIAETSYLIYKAKLQSKSINFTINVPDKVLINIDEVYFGQVIVNLIGNAVKFTPEGGAITMSFAAENKTGTITITDTGAGMNDEIIKKIAGNEPIKSTKGTQGEKGTGLGLKICHKIISDHGYEMRIISSAEQGTNVSVIINQENFRLDE